MPLRSTIIFGGADNHAPNCYGAKRMLLIVMTLMIVLPMVDGIRLMATLLMVRLLNTGTVLLVKVDRSC